MFATGTQFNSPHLHKQKKDCQRQSFFCFTSICLARKKLAFFATQKTGKTRVLILKIIYRDIIVAATVTAFYLDGIFGFFEKFF